MYHCINNRLVYKHFQIASSGLVKQKWKYEIKDGDAQFTHHGLMAIMSASLPILFGSEWCNSLYEKSDDADGTGDDAPEIEFGDVAGDDDRS